MPEPIPPPPPQASVEETAVALRWIFAVMAGALLLFLGIASTYSLRSVFVDYGRDDVVTWVEWKRDTLDPGALRAHEGGRVAWLVGSSIMRASFDEAAANEALAARGSAWRVSKYGFARGAPGQASGFIATLPLREGDLVVVNAYASNYMRDWVRFSNLPHHRVVHLNGFAELWRLPELSVQEKIEASCGVPEAFWNYHAEYMAGVSKWLLAPLDGVPRVQRKSAKLTGNNKQLRFKRTQLEFEEPESNARCVGLEDLDFSPQQYNVQGLARARPRRRRGRGLRARARAAHPGHADPALGAGRARALAGLAGRAGRLLRLPAPGGRLPRPQPPQLQRPGQAHRRSGGVARGQALISSGWPRRRRARRAPR
ncbi:MAG: hypothetical protein H6740_21705 [Alphaproteobacteria bacterium]|nr:hypothetical protein [Alphaproteobacteria bacterium]